MNTELQKFNTAPRRGDVIISNWDIHLFKDSIRFSNGFIFNNFQVPPKKVQFRFCSKKEYLLFFMSSNDDLAYSLPLIPWKGYFKVNLNGISNTLVEQMNLEKDKIIKGKYMLELSNSDKDGTFFYILPGDII